MDREACTQETAVWKSKSPSNYSVNAMKTHASRDVNMCLYVVGTENLVGQELGMLFDY